MLHITQTSKIISPDKVYQERKFMLAEYKEIFSALFKLPDKEAQKRILNAINDIHYTKQTKSVETQTDPIVILEDKSKRHSFKILTPDAINNKTGSLVPPSPLGSPISYDIDDTGATTTQTSQLRKRKRKRKVVLPQANKESRAALAQKSRMARMSRPKTNGELSNGNQFMTKSISDNGQIKRQRLESISSLNYSDLSNDPIDILAQFDKEAEQRRKKQMKQNFLRDYVLSECIMPNGLLPLHNAIITNEITNLQIQIFIWKELKEVDLNELVTEEDEDCLQLAVINDCYDSIIKLLINTGGLNVNVTDAQTNTIIHLAIINDIEAKSLQELMNHIDLKMLLTLNDDGYTALHLAIRYEHYLLAECMLNVIDKRTMGSIFFKRDIDFQCIDEKMQKQQFLEYYEKVCLNIEVDDDDAADDAIINKTNKSKAKVIENNELKQDLLQTGDARSGNTALFFAIENRSEPLIYFLLAHLTDPREENLSGQDCKSYFSEFGRSLNLSLNIDNAMEKVIKLLS